MRKSYLDLCFLFSEARRNSKEAYRCLHRYGFSLGFFILGMLPLEYSPAVDDPFEANATSKLYLKNGHEQLHQIRLFGFALKYVGFPLDPWILTASL